MNTRKLFLILSSLFAFACLLGGCSSISDPEVQKSEPKPVLYSWVEAYADGRLDTVFASDTTTYPGNAPVRVDYLTTVEKLPPYGQALGESFEDTVYLNYGADARDTVAIPRVKIKNKAEILAALDTLTQGVRSTEVPVAAMHFNGDGMHAQFSDTTFMYSTIYPSNEICTGDPCEFGNEFCVTLQFDSAYNATTQYQSAIGFHIQPRSLTVATLTWQVILSNRFGFADTLNGTSYVEPLVCKEVSFKGSTCRSLTVTPNAADTMFSWVEQFADGHQDTVWNINRSQYPGPQSMTFRETSCGFCDWPIMLRRWLPQDTLVCPGDSLWVSPDGLLQWKPRPDTTYLNYGPSAFDAFVEPKVTIANKSEILASSDTAQFFNRSFSTFVDIQHFPGDSVQFQNDPGNTSISIIGVTTHGSISPPCQYNPCDSSTMHLKCLDLVRPDAGSTYEPRLLVSPLDSTSSGTANWKIVVRNRFGYADSLEGTTHLLPFTCAQ
jgi:hypothetical protein